MLSACLPYINLPSLYKSKAKLKQTFMYLYIIYIYLYIYLPFFVLFFYGIVNIGCANLFIYIYII